MKLKNKGNLKEARRQAIIHLKSLPKDVDVKLLLALINYQQGNYQQSQELANQVLNQVPSYIDARVLLVRIALATKKPTIALKENNNGLQQAPNNIELKQLKAKLAQKPLIKQQVIKPKVTYQTLVALNKFGKTQQALKEANIYLKDHPNDADVLLLLGRMYYQQGNYQHSQELANQVLKQVPSYIDARILLVRIALATKKMTLALTEINKGLHQAPNNAELKQLKAKLAQNSVITERVIKPNITYQTLLALYKLGKNQQALKEANIYLKDHPNDADVLLLLGQIYYQQGNYQQSQTLANQVLKQVPSYIDARILLARIALATKKPAIALTEINNGLQQAPNNIELKQLKAKLAQKPLIKQQVIKPQITYQTLVALYKLGKNQQALEEANIYLKDHPNDADVLLLLGQIYYQQGNYQQSQALANQVLKQVPSYLDARILLVRNALATKQIAAALKEINVGLQQAPTNNELKKLKAQLNVAQGAKKVAAEQQPAKQIKNVLDYKAIAALRIAGKLEQAKQEAFKHLRAYPNDADVELIVGQIDYQNKQFDSAKQYMDKILKRTPTYTDARVLLIRILIASNNLIQAQQQYKEGYRLAPRNKELLEVAADITKALKEATYPKPDDLKSIESHYKCIQQQVDPIVKLANCFYENRQYYLAAKIAKQVLCIDTENTKAKGILKDIASTSKKYLAGLNEVGVYTENDHVSDLNEWWNWTTWYYRRHASTGDINAFLNYSQRRGVDGYQEEILLVPILNKNASLEVDTAFSNRYAIFPRFMTRVEGFFTIDKFFSFSIGESYWDLKVSNFSYTTASISKETDNFYLSYRITRYVPKHHEKSKMNFINSRLFICHDNDHYLWATIGLGTSPDLNDLITATFIKIKNRIFYLGYHFPANNNKIAFNIAADYQRQVFPTGRVRKLRGGLIGVSVRF